MQEERCGFSPLQDHSMKVYALVGKSGTGKSYQAMELCEKRGIQAIIDDGLFICNNTVMAGISAKTDPTKIGAVKTALFTQDLRKAEVVKKIREVSPDSILILGTAEGMVKKIAARLEFPPIEEIIRIEDITTPEQREAAHKQRNVMGKHVVPAPTAQLKRQFSGYFMDPMRIFRGWGPVHDIEEEKSVVRPTFSYMGDFFISEKSVSHIVYLTARDVPGVSELKKVLAENRKEELIVRILAVFEQDRSIPKTAAMLQRRCARQIDKMTGFNVGAINVEVRELAPRE